MPVPFAARLLYPAMALVVLAAFYSVYFVKLLTQKRRGIRTNQIGRRKEPALHRVEVLMGLATLCAPAAQLVSGALGWSALPSAARLAGFAVGLLGDGVFLLSVLTMRDSWRAGIPEKDKTELVTTGIYRYSRNPAFLGFDLQYVGVFLLYCNPFTAAFSLFAIVMLHLQILQEERYLTAAFGPPYLTYRKQVAATWGGAEASAPTVSKAPAAPAQKRRAAGALFAMQKHSKIRNVPFPRPCGAAGNDAQKLHAPAFALFRGTVLTHEVLCSHLRQSAAGGDKVLVLLRQGDGLPVVLLIGRLGVVYLQNALCKIHRVPAVRHAGL